MPSVIWPTPKSQTTLAKLQGVNILDVLNLIKVWTCNTVPVKCYDCVELYHLVRSIVKVLKRL